MTQTLLFPPDTLSDSLFIIWPDALSLVDEIRSDLANDVEILADVRILWGADQVTSNAKRLYRRLIYLDDLNEFEPRKTNKNEIHVFYVRDNYPKLALHRSAAGEFETVSLLLAKKKEAYRKIAMEKFSFSYLIHSAGTIEELRLQTPLIFGANSAKDLWAGEACQNRELVVSNDKWDSLKEALDHLSMSVDWCVLRGWNGLPYKHEGDDLDILVSDKFTAASALGLQFRKSDKQERNGYLQLRDGTNIKFDLHWVGDGYFDDSWQTDIIKNAVWLDGVPRPNREDAIFSLLYNELVNRPNPRHDKISDIYDLSKDLITTGWLNEDIFQSESKMLNLLNDYMRSKHYIWTKPLIKRHDQPYKIVKKLPKTKVIKVSRIHITYMRLVFIIKAIVPESILVKFVKLLKSTKIKVTN